MAGESSISRRHALQGVGGLGVSAWFASGAWGDESAADHTCGVAGVWHAGIEGDPGHTGAWKAAYDYTTWKEGMAYPGAHSGCGSNFDHGYFSSSFLASPSWVAPG